MTQRGKLVSLLERGPVRLALSCLIVLITSSFFPGWWCGREAGAFYRGELAAQQSLGREVMAWVEAGVSEKDFQTGASKFNGEWQLVTYQMAALGLIQVTLEHPEWKKDTLPVIEHCLERMLDPDLRSFDTVAWAGEDALTEASLRGPRGHAGYLGYFNVALSLYRQLGSRPDLLAHNDAITGALTRRVLDSPTGLLETYPGELYPTDNSTVIASIALHPKKEGQRAVEKWLKSARADWRDPQSGLLYQAVNGSGTAADKPRSSGTALAIYFLGFVDMAFAKELYDSLKQSCRNSLFGFGALREYPSGTVGLGDVDSGPVIFGLSPSGTGFCLAACRMHEDEAFYTEIFRLATLVGSPYETAGRKSFVCGGPLGNAIMLAMMTAPKRGLERRK